MKLFDRILAGVAIFVLGSLTLIFIGIVLQDIASIR